MVKQSVRQMDSVKKRICGVKQTKTTKTKTKNNKKKVIVGNSNDNDNNNINIDVNVDYNNDTTTINRVPLMRKATALWLIDNTSLSFKQIADFCGIHLLEIEGMADGDVGVGITPANPINNNQLTRKIIDECEKDPNKSLILNIPVADDIVLEKKKRKNNTYVPIAKRGDKPDGIAYLLKFYPDITDKQIRRLINTTTPMIESIRHKTHWNIKEIKPRDPVSLGLCSQSQFNTVVEEIEKRG